MDICLNNFNLFRKIEFLSTSMKFCFKALDNSPISCYKMLKQLSIIDHLLSSVLQDNWSLRNVNELIFSPKSHLANNGCKKLVLISVLQYIYMYI